MAQGGKKKKLAPGVDVTVVEIQIPDAIDAGSLSEVKTLLGQMEDAQYQAAQVNDFIKRARDAATKFAVENEIEAIQLDGHYWRKVVGHSRRWVGTPADMPKKKPKGAMSLKEIVKGIRVRDGIPLWNFITKRVPDDEKINLAVKLGYISEKKISKAYIESENAPFLRRFEGEAVDAEDEE